MTSLDLAFVMISNVTSFLSVSGSLAIISCYVTMKEIRTTSRLLLVFLSVANIIQGLATLLQTGTYYRSVQFPPESSFLCQSAAGLMVLGHVCCALWTVAVTFYLFLCVAGHCITVANRILFLLHAFCWIMPLVVSLSADISGVYGYNMDDVLRHGHPTSCWLSDRVTNPMPWYLLTVEGWTLAAYVIIALLYIPISFAIYCKKTQGKEVEGDDVIEQLAVQTANEQLRFIPVIYVCTRIWGTAHFLLTRYPEHSRLRSYDVFLIIRAMGDNLQGLVNAVFFCLATRQIRRLMYNKLTRCCTWARANRIIGHDHWVRVPSIVRAVTHRRPRKHKDMDGSDLDISGISLDLPSPDGDLGTGEDDVIFER